MNFETLVSVEQYLNTCYDPDVEYVDGSLVERNVGDGLHSLIQSNVIFALRSKYPALRVMPVLRSRTSATRFRLPDISVVRDTPDGKYLTAAAWIAIEILSEADRMSAVLEKLHEYEAHGISNIWVIDPRLQLLSVFRSGSLQTLSRTGFQSEDGGVQLTRTEIFQD